jgi:hypothetical protein
MGEREVEDKGGCTTGAREEAARGNASGGEGRGRIS